MDKTAPCWTGMTGIPKHGRDATASPHDSCHCRASLCAGGGPTGLATAIMLDQLGWRNIRVLDRLPPPKPSDGTQWGNSDRSYMIGVSERGQRVLSDLEVMPRVQE